MAKQPEMLVRWNVAERLLADVISRAGSDRDWERAVREIDQLVSATTLRGDQLNDTSAKTVNEMWDWWRLEAERKYPNDKRLQR